MDLWRVGRTQVMIKLGCFNTENGHPSKLEPGVLGVSIAH